MSVERWLVVPRWEEFQHRDAARQVVPTWIKLHTRLLSDEAYLQLTPTRRAMLVGLWLEYARTRRRLPLDTATLTRRLAQRVRRADLEALSDAGFLHFVAGVPASEVASSEERREELPLTPRSGDDLEDLEERLDDDGERVECARCGKPVRPRSTCRFCDATPRQAGSNPRALAKPSAFDRARSFTLNVGAQLAPVDFLDELNAFALDDGQRADLVALRAQQLNGQGDENPFDDDDDAT